uniref:Uncharacterized protein n=1 Tax=Oryza meridionalis TaxID=40149 RepID=A0A0E0ES04_9ORYZ
MASTILRSAGGALRRSVLAGEQRLLTRRAVVVPALSAMEENPRRLSSASCDDGSTHKAAATAPSSSSDPAAELGNMENNEFLVCSYVSKKLDNIENLLDKMEALRKESDEADARFAQLRPYKAFACVSGILAFCYCASLWLR